MVVTTLLRHASSLPRAGWDLVASTGQRVLGLVEEAEAVLERAAVLLARLEVLLDLMEREAAAVADLVARVEPQPELAAEAVEEVRAVSRDAAGTRALAQEQVRRLERLVDDYEAPLRSLSPLLVQAVRELQPRHLTAIGALLDVLPALVDRLEPALRALAELAPGFTEVAERVDDVGQVVEGLPGANLLRRRGQAREAED